MKGKCKRFLLKIQILADNRGFGMNELLSIAAALIIAAFVIIPNLRTFAADLMADLSEWWNKDILEELFPSS